MAGSANLTALACPDRSSSFDVILLPSGLG